MWLFKGFDKKRTQNLLKLSIERMTLLQNKKKATPPRQPTPPPTQTEPIQLLPRPPLPTSLDLFHKVHPWRAGSCSLPGILNHDASLSSGKPVGRCQTPAIRLKHVDAAIESR